MTQQNIETEKQKIIAEIKKALTSKKFDDDIQIELARLLYLLADFDISKSERTNINLDNWEIINTALSTILNEDQNNNEKNLEFVKESRRIFERKIRINPNPIEVVKFWKTKTNPFYRLVSGLIWFLIFITLIVPSCFILLDIVKSKLPNKDDIDLLNYNLKLKTQKIESLTDKLIKVQSEKTNLIGKISILDTNLNSKREKYLQQYCSTNDQIKDFIDEDSNKIKEQCSLSETLSSGSFDKFDDKYKIKVLNQEKTVLTKKFNNLLNSYLEINDFSLNNLDEILTNLERFDDKLISETALSLPQTRVQNNSKSQVEIPDKSQVEILDRSIYPDEYIFIWVAISGVVSLVIRTNELIKDAEDKEIDLFYVGFFRPLVGMCFGLLVICIIESGAFSNIITLNAEPDDKYIYMYMSISFVLGVSNILGDNLVRKTESIINK